MTTIHYRDFAIPVPGLGMVRIVGHGEALTHCSFFDSRQAAPVPPDWQRPDTDSLLDNCQHLLNDYFTTGRLSGNITLAPAGTDFQRRVWDVVQEIPVGETCTYAEIAARIGRPSAVRAVAAAIGRNPVCIFIPCHRVIGSNGALTGYAWGLERKAQLLKLESALR